MTTDHKPLLQNWLKIGSRIFTDHHPGRKRQPCLLPVFHVNLTGISCTVSCTCQVLQQAPPSSEVFLLLASGWMVVGHGKFAFMVPYSPLIQLKHTLFHIGDATNQPESRLRVWHCETEIAVPFNVKWNETSGCLAREEWVGFCEATKKA